MSSAILSIKNLRTQFTQTGLNEQAGEVEIVKAVDGVSFDIHRGETFALVGESGCGKSVTALSALRLLPDNAQITDGEVIYDGVDLLREPENRVRNIRGAKIAMIFQDPMTSLNPVMSIGEQIIEAIQAHTKSVSKSNRQRVVELIHQVGIPDAKQRYDQFPHQLSGGMRQRVLIAIALASEPDLLIADEPTTALDVTIQAQILELLKELQKQNGMALWIITHDLGIVSDIADTVAVMYAGELVEIAPRDNFFKSPAHPYSKRLFQALPQFENRGQQLVTLAGSVPSLTESFTGCRFADRCDFCIPECLKKSIDWFETKPLDRHLEAQFKQQHKARCLRLQSIDNPNEAAEPAAQPIAVEQSFEKQTETLSIDALKVYFPIKKGFLKKTVGHVKAVDDISFDIESGKTVALVGESGCGKSTLAKALLQLIPSSYGKITFDNQDLTKLSSSELRSFRSRLQIIFQDPFSSMNPRMLVGEIIEEGMLALERNLTPLQRRERCEALLEQVGMKPEARLRYPHEFSGGQRQRLCIARALAVNPSVIICDEPTSALDVSVQAQVLNLLKSLQQQRGLGYLFITHDLSVVSYLADTVQVMYLGQIVESGTVEEVMQSPAHPYTQALIKAVPQIDAKGSREVIKLADNLPSPANPPAGCRFHTRCNSAMSHCAQSQPKYSVLSSTHKVACFLY